MLVIGKPSFLNVAIILIILVSTMDKVRNHLQGLIHGYLDDGVHL